ncbi:X2-like carbohydrate binding domain-containing protein [Paenibacillus oryzisoli]|uniref:X2-like carbohydrate binding domain-containing protein n=1 Tax=Paenibacillus oryzisoli TaxID=1850517 RepID=UPI003D2E779F
MKKWFLACLIAMGMLLGSLAQPKQVDAASPILFSEVDSYNYTNVALDSDGRIWAWGQNEGKFGNGDKAAWSFTPQRISVTEGGSEVVFKRVQVGISYAIALDIQGNIWVTGSNEYGQLGVGAGTTELLSWTKLGLPVTFTEVDAARITMAAIDSDGYIWMWGATFNASTRVYDAVYTPTKQAYEESGTPIKFSDISMNETHGIALDVNKKVWTIYNFSPTLSPLPGSFTSISTGGTYGFGGNFSVALDASGDLWTWGSEVYGYQGEFGNGDQSGTLVPSPTRISVSDNGSPVKFKQVHAGVKYVLALDTNNTLWTWGQNTSWQLGDGTTSNQYVPHKLPVSLDGNPVQFQLVYGGQDASYAVDTNGRMWAWGKQQFLGLGLSGQQTTPVRFYLQPGVTLTSSPSSSTYLQQVTLKAKITGDYFTPTGTVEFKDGVTTLGSAPVNGSGEAQLNISNLTEGSHSLTAVYSGDAIYAAKVPTASSYTVTKPAAPNIQITPSSTANTAGPVTLTVAVQANGDGNSIVSTKWLSGNQDVSAFASAGTNVTSGSFVVSNGGDYTIYAKDAVGNEKVTVYKVMNMNSDISLTTANFDKYTGSADYTDIATTITFKGNTLASIKNGTAALALGTDYTVSGSMVTIRKAYLASQSTGTAMLTFAFSGGAVKTLKVSVSDTTPSISPATAGFDKYAGAAGYADVVTTMTLNNDTLTSVKNGTATLASETDYTVSGSMVTFASAYLAAQPTGTTSLTFTFSGGATQNLDVSVSDTTPSISPVAASYDKYTGAAGYADVVTTLTFNHDTLASIQNGETELTAGTDYTVSGSTVTLAAAYLTEQPVGPISLTFTFSGGATQNLDVSVSDTTPIITTPTASYDRYLDRQHDLVTALNLYNDTLLSVINHSSPLTAGVDYTLDGSTLTIAEAYLAAQPNGVTNLTFTFSGGAEKELTVSILDTTPSSDDGSYTPPSPPVNGNPAPAYRLEEDPRLGVILYIDTPMLVNQTKPDGTTIQKVQIPDNVANEAANLLAHAARPHLIIRTADTAGGVQVELSGSAMETISRAVSGTVVELAGRHARLELQAGGFDLASLAKRMGVAIADLKIVTTMEQVGSNIVKQLQQVGVDGGFQVVGTPVNFQIHIEAKGQRIALRDMGGMYLVRAIIHDADTVPGHVLAVFFDPATGSVVPVPNKRIVREDGQVEVELQAPNFSIYSMVSTSKRSFSDLQGHWSEQDVELLASNLVVNGVTNDRFAPDVSITRAEFASLLVRAMGMSAEEDPAYRSFADVASDAWYALPVEAASKAGLIEGISTTEFAPNAPITREQMAVMIARAQALVRTLQTVPSSADNRPPHTQTFADAHTISAWAFDAVEKAVASGIMDGLEQAHFAPADLATRAQAATILKRFMQNVGFIEG